MIFCDFYFAFITSQNQKDFIVSVLVWSISFLIALQHTILNQNQSLTCGKKKNNNLLTLARIYSCFVAKKGQSNV